MPTNQLFPRTVALQSWRESIRLKAYAQLRLQAVMSPEYPISSQAQDTEAGHPIAISHGFQLCGSSESTVYDRSQMQNQHFQL